MIQSVFLCILKLHWCELEQNNVEEFMSEKLIPHVHIKKVLLSRKIEGNRSNVNLNFQR